MANFQKLSEVNVIEEVKDTSMVLVEENGEIYRAPKTSVGGAGIKTAIIKDSTYDNALAGLQTAASDAPATTYECINMTFEEAYQAMASGEPLAAIGLLGAVGAMNISGMTMFGGISMFGVPCIGILFTTIMGSNPITIATLYWTADGLSTETPSSGK